MPKNKADLEKNVMALLLGDEDEATEKTLSAADKLSIDVLVPYPNHKFKLYTGKRLDDMVWSIKEVGVLMPVIVRPLDEDEGTYEILSGHNRVNAARIAGLTDVPVIIKTNLTEHEINLIVFMTNLYQRSFADLSHSERAVVLKHYMETIKAQGKRNDLLSEIESLSNPDKIGENGTSGLIDHKLQARDKAGEKYGLDARTVSRYIRLCELNEYLLSRVDDDEIGLYPAVSLSYLPPAEQTELNRILNENAYKVNMKKAKTLREFSENNRLTADKMIQILSGKLKKKSSAPLKIKAKIYQKYFDADTTQSEMEAIIDKALSEYFENHKEE